jgi:hypothetical protein
MERYDTGKKVPHWLPLGILQGGLDMSRSYRHTPIFGNATGRSQQEDKRVANRAFRRVNKQRLYRQGEDATFALMEEVSDDWGWEFDGRGWRRNVTEKDMRK